MSDIFDVIADPTRRELLRVLLERAVQQGDGEPSVGDLVTRLGVTQPTVSKHLKVLRDAGLVRVRDDAQRRYYRLEVGPLEELEAFLIPFMSVDATGTADESDDGVSPAYAAWAGSDVGQSLGRRIADGAFSARSVVQGATDRVHEATELVQRRIPKSFSWPWSKRD